MLLETLSRPYRKALSANYATNGYAGVPATGTAPSGAGAIDLCQNLGGGPVQNSLKAVLYGTGADNATGSARLYGLRVLGDQADTLLWVPVLLVEVAFTLSTAVGVAGRLISDTERFADTITLTTGTEGDGVEVVSPTGNVPAHLLVDLKGSRYAVWDFTTGGSATDVNALWSLL